MIDSYKELLSEAKTSHILIRYARKRICDNRQVGLKKKQWTG